MKKSFKRFLSSVLAVVMTVSIMSVGMVTNVLAADSLSVLTDEVVAGLPTTYQTATNNNGKTTITYDFAKLTTILPEADRASGKNIVFSDGVITTVNKVSQTDTSKRLYGLTGEVQTTGGTETSPMKLSGDSKYIGFTVAAGYVADVVVNGTVVKDDGTTCVCLNKGGVDRNPSTAITPAYDGTAMATYTGLEASEYRLYRGYTNFRISSLTITLYVPTYTDGKVTYTSTGSGSITVADASGAVASGTSCKGGTKLTLAVTPDDGYYAVATVNGENTVLDNNSCSITVDGDTAINVEFKKQYYRSPITSTISYALGDNTLKTYGAQAENDYYFELTSGASIDANKITINKFNTDKSNNALVFSIGDLNGKTATLDMHYKSGGSSARTMDIYNAATNAKLATLANMAKDDNTTEYDIDPYTLSENTEYFIATTTGGMYIYSFKITVSDGGDVPPTTEYTWTLDTSKLTISDLEINKLTLASTTTSTTTNTLSYTGSGYTLNADKTTVTGTPNGNNVITISPEDSWFTAVTEPDPTPIEGAITDRAVLTFTENDKVAKNDITADTDKTYCDYFTVHFASKKSEIAASSRSVDGLASYTYEYKTGGTGGTISFKTSGPATLQVVARSASDGTPRNIKVAYEDETVYSGTASIVGVKSGTSIVPTTLFKLPKAGTYTISTPDGGVNFFSVNVIIGTIDNVAAGNVFTQTSNAYMIASISESQVGNNDQISITANNTTTVPEGFVYKAALIDGQLITANELGADYIYVVKAIDAVKNGAIDAAKAFVVNLQ